MSKIKEGNKPIKDVGYYHGTTKSGSRFTVAVTQTGEAVKAAVALCGPKDNFCRKIGRDIARGRLEKDKKAVFVGRQTEVVSRKNIHRTACEFGKTLRQYYDDALKKYFGMPLRRVGSMLILFVLLGGFSGCTYNTSNTGFVPGKKGVEEVAKLSEKRTYNVGDLMIVPQGSKHLVVQKIAVPDTILVEIQVGDSSSSREVVQVNEDWVVIARYKTIDPATMSIYFFLIGLVVGLLLMYFIKENE